MSVIRPWLNRDKHLLSSGPVWVPFSSLRWWFEDLNSRVAHLDPK